ncbi:MAG: hypothetical protein ACM3PE_07035 [Deltaproteobacteria bacterium]
MSESAKLQVSKTQVNQIAGAAFVLKNLIDNVGHAFSDEEMPVLKQALHVLEDKQAEVRSAGQG